MRLLRRLRLKDLTLSAPPQPYSTILHCGICGQEVHRVLYGDVRWPHVVAVEAEQNCYDHYRCRHPHRFRLWRRLGRKWLVRGLV